MTNTRAETAEILAKAHLELEDSVLKVYRLLAPNEDDKEMLEPVKLLEVNEATPSAGIVPVHFGADSPDVPYPSVVVEVTAQEFGEIEAKKLALPDSWTLGELIVERNAAAH